MSATVPDPLEGPTTIVVMLTRFKVTGFKNLVDVDVRFGPFTCVAGANAVGKSNLFDAIGFLNALATMPLAEAARSVRDSRTADARSLFHHVGDFQDPTMRFDCEMIIPKRGFDDLGQEIEAAMTFVHYTLILGLKPAAGRTGFGGLQLEAENLDYIKISEAGKHLLFEPSPEWRASVLSGRKTSPFISTITKDGVSMVSLHQDRGDSGGKPRLFPTATLPRTVLSHASGVENRTAVLVRREMESWRRLQLEPAALRKPDDFNTPPRMGADGAHSPPPSIPSPGAARAPTTREPRSGPTSTPESPTGSPNSSTIFVISASMSTPSANS